MSRDVASTSLMEHLSETGFQASLISTYNCYFPFYEDVVLRRLMAAGCTHNLVMVDAVQCAEMFASDDLRPHRAGRDYTLIPVRVGGAFHSKMFLRLGKSKGSLFVGSHNLTLAGFGLNDEVTNIFRVDGPSVRTGGSPLRLAFDYLATFIPSGLAEVVEAYENLKLGIPWMDGPLGGGDPARALLMTSGRGPDLWSQVIPRVPQDVSRVFICSPFFDSDLAFVKRLQQEVGPRELVIGFDPASVEIDPGKATRLAGVRWVNVAGVPSIPQRREKSFHYMHAKILWFEGKRAELLVTGSANLSVAAFFASPSARNAEAVVCDHRRGAGAELGMEELLGAPTISQDDWEIIAGRWEASNTVSKAPTRRVWVAIPTTQGFRAQEPLPAGIPLVAKGDSGLYLGVATVCNEPGTAIEASADIRDGARYLEGLTSEAHLLVIIHRTEEISKNVGGDVRKALRQVLGTLEEDPSQLATVLKLTEKVIFDSDDVVRTRSLHPADSPETSPEPEDGGAASLALDAAGRKSSKRKRSLASGDIVVLLDALIRRLGEGLPSAAPPDPRQDGTEDGGDEEDGGELGREAPNLEDLAKTCRGKARRLVKRMEGQFELAAAPEKARLGVVQLAAVLAVVRMLRMVEQRAEWRRRQLLLIDPNDKWRLFEEAVLAVFWGDGALGPRACAETNGEGFDELSFVVGLLAWLAWDLEVDVEEASQREGTQGVEDESWFPVQLLAALGPWLSEDDSAAALIEDSVMRTPRLGVDGRRWLQVHRALMEGYALVAADSDQHGQAGRHPLPGDLVVLSSRESPRVRVVLNVQPWRDSSKVVLFDPSDPSKERSFVASYVASLPWLRVHARSAASA